MRVAAIAAAVVRSTQILTGKSPPAAWNTSALIRAKYTPDAALLYTRAHWLHFNYDVFTSEEQRAIGFTDSEFQLWRKDLGEHGYGHVALPAKPTDRSCSSVPWADQSLSQGSFNIPLAARVRGVLERLPTDEFFKLDTDLENGVVFERKRVSILCPMWTIVERTRKRKNGTTYQYRTQEMFVRKYHAWMYQGNEKRFSEGDAEGNGAIDAGFSYDIAKLSIPQSLWIGPFYYAE